MPTNLPLLFSAPVPQLSSAFSDNLGFVNLEFHRPLNSKPKLIHTLMVQVKDCTGKNSHVVLHMTYHTERLTLCSLPSGALRFSSLNCDNSNRLNVGRNLNFEILRCVTNLHDVKVTLLSVRYHATVEQMVM